MKKFIAGLISVFFIVILVGVLTNEVGTISEGDDIRVVSYPSTSDTILADSGIATTLTQTPSTWSSATVKNQTWLEFDGVNDMVNVSSDYEIISFWYKNATTDWQHIVNNSGTIYVNGSTGTALLFPIYYDGANYILGKNESTFYDVDIDDVRVYNRTIETGEIDYIYNIGR